MPLVALFLFLPTLLSAVAAPARHFAIEERYEVPAAAAPVTVWLPAPTSDAWQTITGLTLLADGHPADATIVRDARDGNSIYRVTVPPRGGALTLRFSVARKERSADVRRATGHAVPKEYQRWLLPDARVPLDEHVRQVAALATSGTKSPLAAARAVYGYVLETMRYDKPADQTGWGQGDIHWACDMKYGNCTDFHALVIGLLRASGVPARFTIGYAVPDGKSAPIAGYHCWADFYLDGVGWVPVDASEGWKHPDKRDYYFGHHDANRVALSTGRDIVLPGMKGAPLNFFINPYAEASGRPVAVKTVSVQSQSE